MRGGTGGRAEGVLGGETLWRPREGAGARREEAGNTDCGWVFVNRKTRSCVRRCLCSLYVREAGRQVGS